MKTEARINEIFAQAQECKSPAEHEKYLAEVCQSDPELRPEIEFPMTRTERDKKAPR